MTRNPFEHRKSNLFTRNKNLIIFSVTGATLSVLLAYKFESLARFSGFLVIALTSLTGLFGNYLDTKKE